VILVHLTNGTTLKLDPAVQRDREAIDHPYNQRGISRVSILDREGHRADLPPLKGRNTRIWIEFLSKNGMVKGERVNMRYGKRILQTTLYFSDGRVVINFTE